MLCDTSAPVALNYLFAAVGAHLGADVAGEQVLLREAHHAGLDDEVTCCAVLTAGEYLRDVAEERDLAPSALLGVLVLACADLHGSNADQTWVLRSVREYLEGSSRWWDLLGERPDSAVLAAAAVRVVAAALVWHAADESTDPLLVARRACVNLAA